MSVFFLVLYVLIWPVIVAGTLFYITRAFFAEWKESRRRGDTLV